MSCTEENFSPEIYFFTGGIFALVVFSLLSFLRRPLISSRRIYGITFFCQKILQNRIFADICFCCSLWGLIVHIMFISLISDNLNSCQAWVTDFDRPWWTLGKWSITVIDGFFFIRSLCQWVGHKFYPQFLIITRDLWLFGHSVMNLLWGQYVFAFQFFTFLRCYDLQFRNILFKLLAKVVGKSWHLAIYQCLYSILSIFLIASVIHSAEEFQTNHDKFTDNSTKQILVKRYWEYVYFTTISLAGCGYGDIVMQTFIGRQVLVIFIIISFGILFLKFGQLVDLIKVYYNQSRYSRTNFNHKPKIIVTGNFNGESLESFLTFFLHPTRKLNHLDVIVLLEEPPNLILKDVLSPIRNARFALGDLRDDDHVRDLLMGSRPKSESCLIVLVDEESPDQKQQDLRNLTVVNSVKTLFPALRVICQVFDYLSKRKLRCLQSWTDSDRIICIEQVTSSLAIANAKAPGSASLLYDMLRPPKSNRKATIAGFRDLIQKLKEEDETWNVDETTSSAVDADEILLEMITMSHMQTIRESPISFQDEISFQLAALAFYNYNAVLLGYVSGDNTILLPEMIPPNSFALYFAEDKLPVEEAVAFADTLQGSMDGVSTVEFKKPRQKNVFIFDLASFKHQKGRETVTKILKKNREMYQKFSFDDAVGSGEDDSVIFVDSRHHVEGLRDVELLRYIKKFVTERNKEKEQFITCYLNDGDEIIHATSQYSIRRLYDQLQCLGRSISPKMTVPLVSIAYDRPGLYRSLTSIIDQWRSNNFHVELLTTKIENGQATYGQCFRAAVIGGSLLLGIYKKLRPNSNERISIPSPPQTLVVTTDDVLIMLVKQELTDDQSSVNLTIKFILPQQSVK